MYNVTIISFSAPWGTYSVQDMYKDFICIIVDLLLELVKWHIGYHPTVTINYKYIASEKKINFVYDTLTL